MKLSKRMSQYRERILSSKPTICTERALIYTETYKKNEDQAVILKRAYALSNTLNKMTLIIEPEDLIVGNHSSRIYAAPVFPEYAVEWIEKEINEFEKRPGDAYYPDNAAKKQLLEITKYWNKKTTLDKGRALMSEQLREIHETQIIRAEGNLTSGDAHIAIHFEKLIKRGIGDYLTETRNRKAAITDLSREDNLNKIRYYEATEISIKALQNYILRFSILAASLKDNEKDPDRICELEIIEKNCRHLAVHAPDNFYQGLQLVYLSQVVLQIESNGHSLSLGRMDQYLYPLYKADTEKGSLDESFIMELLTNVWLKLVSIKKIRSWSHTRFSAGGPLYQNVTIGGQLQDGKDAVNDLSFLILKSVGAAKLTQPNLSVRFHPGIDQNFLMKCIDVIQLGFGMPSFNNDSIVIPSLKELGVENADAWDYSAIGCIEIAVPGRWGYRCTGKHFLNFMRVFLAAINDGTDPVSGKQFCKGTGNLEDFTEFDQVMKAWDKQVRFYAGAGIAIDSAIDIVLRDEAPDLLCSAFTDDCLSRGLTIHQGGSKYDFVSGLQVGIANLADSLSVIKKLVFDEKRVSAADLKLAIQSNFEGSSGEKLRQLILSSVPRYGNDDDYVDELINEAYGYYIDEIKNYRTIREGCGPIGCKYFAGTSSISGNVPAGAVVPATPDGRKAGKPLAEGASPSGGADISGPTAVMKSISKLQTASITGGVLLNQKLNPSMLESLEKRELLTSMLHGFFDELKGWHVQYNIVERKTLLAAQKNPEEYRDLIVRVAGYSAFFTNLSPDTQNDIIERTEQVI
jgi:pyruvate formate-lyase/glycerol dehydratase family glycyl radical enzyme